MRLKLGFESVAISDHAALRDHNFQEQDSAEVTERVGRAVVRLSAEHAGRDIVAVAHGGSIRAAVALALELSPETALALSIGHCSLTRLDHIAGPSGSHDSSSLSSWRVVQLNLSL